MNLSRIVCVTLALTVLGLPVSAELSRIEITSRTSVLDGRSFGLAGPYEKLSRKAYFALDPAAAANKQIVDLDKASRDAQGRV
jgi:hypothetical protein